MEFLREVLGVGVCLGFLLLRWFMGSEMRRLWDPGGGGESAGGDDIVAIDGGEVDAQTGILTRSAAMI